MTIAIVVETGAGNVQTANSYCTVADLRAYALMRGITVPTLDDDCAALLIRAMDYLEAQRDRYKGVKTTQYQNLNGMCGAWGVGYWVVSSPIPAEGSTDQPLQWPRYGVQIDNAILPPNFIPRELVYGQLAQCLLLQDQATNPDSYSGKGPVIEESVGPIITRYASPYQNPGKVLPVNAFAHPDTLLNVLYKRGGMSIAVSRA